MDLYSILLVAVICIAIGFFIGQLISGLSNEKNEDSNEESGENLLKIWEETDKDDLVVEIDGVIFRDRSGLDADQRDRIQRTILKLNLWLDHTAPAFRPQEETHPLDESSPEPVVSEDTRPRFNFNPVRTFVNALQADVPKSQLPVENITQQIDDILQEKLRNSSLKGEAVRLMDWPGKGMVVMVGLDRYEDVEDVPNEEVREIIRSAAKEWEQRNDESAKDP